MSIGQRHIMGAADGFVDWIRILLDSYGVCSVHYAAASRASTARQQGKEALVAPLREYLIKTWDEGWEKSWWWPAFSVVFQDLTPQQAAWKPSPQRHSIWQILNHMTFWREVCV